MNRALFLCLSSTIFFLRVEAACPSIEPVSDFDVSGIQGHWYTVQKSRANLPCLTLNFTAGKTAGEYHVVETYQSAGLLNNLGLQHENHLKGKLTVPNPKTPGVLEVALPLMTLRVTVIATDYDNYAAFSVCKRGFALVNTPWVIVSSRTPSLGPKHLKSVYSQLTKIGVDPYAIDVVRQEGCPRHGERGPALRTATGILDRVKQTFGNIANAFRPRKQKIPEKPEDPQYDIDVRSSFTE